MDEYVIEEKSLYDKVLDFLVFLAVFVVTIFLLLEILASSGKSGLELELLISSYMYINIVVFVIFLLDLVRLWKQSSSFGMFLSKNWLDILATIPFGLIANGLVTFEVLKLARLSRLSRLSKLQRATRISKISKEFKAASHLKKESEKYKNKNRL